MDRFLEFISNNEVKEVKFQLSYETVHYEKREAIDYYGQPMTPVYEVSDFDASIVPFMYQLAGFVLGGIFYTDKIEFAKVSDENVVYLYTLREDLERVIRNQLKKIYRQMYKDAPAATLSEETKALWRNKFEHGETAEEFPAQAFSNAMITGLSVKNLATSQSLYELMFSVVNVDAFINERCNTLLGLTDTEDVASMHKAVYEYLTELEKEPLSKAVSLRRFFKKWEKMGYKTVQVTFLMGNSHYTVPVDVKLPEGAFIKGSLKDTSQFRLKTNSPMITYDVNNYLKYVVKVTYSGRVLYSDDIGSIADNDYLSSLELSIGLSNYIGARKVNNPYTVGEIRPANLEVVLTNGTILKEYLGFCVTHTPFSRSFMQWVLNFVSLDDLTAAIRLYSSNFTWDKKHLRSVWNNLKDKDFEWVKVHCCVDMTEGYAAKKFLDNYIKENNIQSICDLFSKETLIEYASELEWEWSVKDEMDIYNCTEEEAQRKTYEWFDSKSKLELWVDKISDYSKECLLTDKAYDLGFEW